MIEIVERLKGEPKVHKRVSKGRRYKGRKRASGGGTRSPHN